MLPQSGFAWGLERREAREQQYPDMCWAEKSSLVQIAGSKATEGSSRAMESLRGSEGLRLNSSIIHNWKTAA